MTELSEPTEPVKQISPNEWEGFLESFSKRNYDRKAGFELFKGGNVAEEGSTANLEEVRLTRNGKNVNIEVIRIDRTEADAHKIKDEITNVRGISVQYDVDGSEDVLEITDNENSLISLKMESKVDGNL
jgi:hypothetical protein